MMGAAWLFIVVLFINPFSSKENAYPNSSLQNLQQSVEQEDPEETEVYDEEDTSEEEVIQQDTENEVPDQTITPQIDQTKSYTATQKTNYASEANTNVQKISPPADQQNVTVYITRTGHKYHRDGCRYLARSQIPISLSEAKAEGYEPCKVCCPPQ